MSRHDFARDPCPWRLVEDMGGAYSMGLVGGGIFHGVKTALKVKLPNHLDFHPIFRGNAILCE